MEERSVPYGNSTVWYHLVRTDRRTLGFIIHPDTRVELRAPHSADVKKVDELVMRKAAWIRRQQDFFRAFLPLTPPREYVSGETHRYLGKQYRLKVSATKGKEEVKLLGGRLHVLTHHPKDALHVSGLLAGWYRSKATARFEKAADHALEVLKKHKLTRPSVIVRRMSMRWGSCTPKGRIMLNPELIKAPGRCIDYVVIHELCHLIHPDHSNSYYRLLDRVMPDWKRWKERLEHSM
ncbi:MAG: M48 family metallopeptidase [Flavobacteriales bacterium]|nr:M48 family metallopeptidase [Flavobacteriales bacterium]